MPWDGSGNVTRTNGTNGGDTVWQDDRDDGVNIRADRHDTHDEDLAQSIENTVALDGQNTTVINGDLLRYSTGSDNKFVGESPGTGQNEIPTNADIILTSNKTVNIPTDYSTLQDAIDAESRYRMKQGVTITLNIESGHQPASGIKVEHGDYGHFKITSADATVTVASGYSGRFLDVFNAVGPQLHAKIDANSLGGSGVWVTDGGYVYIEGNCGVINAGDRGLYVNGGRVTGGLDGSNNGIQFQGAAGRALWATRNALVKCERANFSNAATAAGELTAVYLSRASIVHAASCDVSSSDGNHALWVHRGSTWNGQEATYGLTSASTDACIWANRGSTIIINGDTGVGRTTVNAENAIALECTGGSTIFAPETDLIPGSSNSTQGIDCSGDSSVIFRSSTMDGFGGNNIFVDEFGHVDAGGAEIKNAGNNGVFGRHGSRINLRGATVTGNSNNDMAVTFGSQIFADGVTTTSGSPAVGDTNVSSFNAIDSNNGIIWS